MIEHKMMMLTGSFEQKKIFLLLLLINDYEICFDNIYI